MLTKYSGFLKDAYLLTIDDLEETQALYATVIEHKMFLKGDWFVSSPITDTTKKKGGYEVKTLNSLYFVEGNFKKLSVNYNTFVNSIREYGTNPEVAIAIRNQTFGIEKADKKMVYLEKARRYMQLKKRFLAKNESLDIFMAAERVHISEENKEKLIKALSEMGVIILDVENELFAPAFQFSLKTSDFSAHIKPLLDEIEARKMDPVEVCSFLTEMTSVDVRHFDFNEDVDLDDITEIAEREELIFNGKPFDLLIASKYDVFNVVVDAWLNYTTYKKLSSS